MKPLQANPSRKFPETRNRTPLCLTERGDFLRAIPKCFSPAPTLFLVVLQTGTSNRKIGSATLALDLGTVFRSPCAVGESILPQPRERSCAFGRVLSLLPGVRGV